MDYNNLRVTKRCEHKGREYEYVEKKLKWQESTNSF